ncbi:MAG: SDR family NAD(P)-dependent oxidoreductase [Albidovulum sp.]|nr:SDR family NAD(P)-dependent oxidoreductase [Albidovulum sp.]
MNKNSLDGRHALVTGGGTGIGLAIAQALSNEGSMVTIAGRTEAVLERAAERFGFHAEVMDVANPASVRDATESAVAANGPVNIHVANAGIAESMPFGDMSPGFWRNTMATNLDGAFYSAKESLVSMREADWGRIIFVASVAGLRGLKGASAYTVSKHGMVGLARALSEELRFTGITVNALCPGYVDTAIVERSSAEISERTGRSREEAVQSLVRLNRHKRLIKPEEVASAALWLCLPGSESFNGQAVSISGGQV